MPEEKDIDDIHRAVSEAQLEKLTLEIEELKHKKEKKTFSEKITPYIGLISVIIGVSGFLFGVIQFLSQSGQTLIAQERELSEKIENHISTDVEKILLFTKEEKVSVAHMTYLFEDLETYINLKAGKAENENPDDVANALTRGVSEKLLFAVQNDCDFEKYKDVVFLWSVLANWKDFADALKENDGINVAIVDHQRAAVATFYDKNPQVVSTMTYENSTWYFPHGHGEFTRGDITHLRGILSNIQNTFKSLSDENQKKEAVLAFQGATCNRTLTKQILGMDYEPKDYRELSHCI